MPSDAETPRQEEIEIVARAIEAQTCAPLEWTPEQFDIWWTKDARNRNHETRRAQARLALDELRKAGFRLVPPGVGHERPIEISMPENRR